jgi:hypothetical protein
MAYMNQETKGKIVASLKPLLAFYGIKATFSVRNHSTIVVNIKAGEIDFIENYCNTVSRMTDGRASNIGWIREHQNISVNPYWYHEHFTGKALDFLSELFKRIKTQGNWYDNSDIMTDYFDTAFYVDVNIGSYDKPYKVI